MVQKQAVAWAIVHQKMMCKRKTYRNKRCVMFVEVKGDVLKEWAHKIIHSLSKFFMSRPRKKRRIIGMPEAFFYKPQGVPLRQLKTINISLEEFEAMRLKNVKKMHQSECAEQMHISQSTFQRILTDALEKISIAITEGRAIRIAKK